MTSPNSSTTARMVSTSASQPGKSSLGEAARDGSTVMVITTASKIG